MPRVPRIEKKTHGAEGDELHDRIRRLLFASPALARAFARGDFRSVFRGRGIEFDSLREYYPDDDARLIDVSSSMDQGSGELSKLDEAVLVSSLVAYAAQLRGLPVGCLVFADGILGSLPPRRGKAHAMAVASSVGAAARGAARKSGSARNATGLGLALRTVTQVLKRRSLVLILSDFRADAWARPLGELARRHDAVAVRLSDRSDLDLPRAGSFFVADPETGAELWLPLGSRSFRDRWRAIGAARRKDCLETCARARASVLEIDTSDDPALKLLEFFERRRVI
jgi:uncharacterized protein (DUF58 family)